MSTWNIPEFLDDAKSMRMSREMTLLLEELLNGNSVRSLATAISGVAQAQAQAASAAAAAAAASSNASTATGTAASAGGTMAVTAAPLAAYGYGRADSRPDTITTDPVTFTIIGGTSPYSWVEASVSGDVVTPLPGASGVVSSGTTFDLTWRATVAGNASATGVRRVTVTDAAAASFAVDVPFDLDNIGYL